MKGMNLDVVSPTHPAVAKELANALKNSADENLTNLTPYLENWNGDHQLNDIGPSVYYNILAFTLKEMMVDELGEEPFKTLLSTSYMKNSYFKLISNESSPWWDDVRTKDKKETRTEIVERATIKVWKLISKKYGDDPQQWEWKKMHTLTHGHPLGAVKPLDRIFNVGPLEAPGGIEVLNNLAFVLDTLGHFSVTAGPARRKITDFSNVENGITVSPTGLSGNLMSPHYDDQAEMFVEGQFRKMLMNKETIQQGKNKLVLKRQ
jgi:penicillin amidase